MADLLGKQMVEKLLTEPGCIHKKVRKTFCGGNEFDLVQCWKFQYKNKSINRKLHACFTTEEELGILISPRLLIAVTLSCDRLVLQMKA